MRGSLAGLCLTIIFMVASFSNGNATSCGNDIGQRFDVSDSPFFPGAIVVVPVNFQGNAVIMAPVDHPTVAYANVDWAGNGTVLFRNGQLGAVWGGQAVFIAQCFNFAISPPPVLPAEISTLPTDGSRGTPVPGQEVVATNPLGGEASYVQPEGALPMLIDEEDAIACVNDNQGDGSETMRCLVDGMSNETQRAAFTCIEENADKIEGGKCLARELSPEAAEVIDKLDECGVTDNDTDWDCLAKSTLRGRTLSAYRCVADDDGGVDACLDALGTDERTRRAVALIEKCYESGSDTTDYALCALQGSGNKDITRAAGCVEQQLESGDPSYVGAGICFAAGSLNLNAEQRIAVECAVSSGGQPYAFAVCAGGRLTARELTKCFTDGVGGDGCFGENNEIIKALRVAGIDVNDLANPNGEVIKAWNTVSNDLRNGPGPNNDVVRPLNQVGERVGTALDNARSDITQGPGPNNEIVKFANNAANDLAHGPGPNNEVVKVVRNVFGGLF